MRYRGYQRNTDAIIGWCAVAVAIGITAGCNNGETNTPATGAGGAAGIAMATSGTRANVGDPVISGSRGQRATATSGGSGASTGGTTAVTGGTTGILDGTGGMTAIDAGQSEGTVVEATGGTGAPPGDADVGPVMTSSCGTADNVDQEVGPGPFTATHIENTGPRRSSWVFHPQELGRDGCMHPIFNWGPGAGTGPANYLDHLNHLASHGFVIISQPSSGMGEAEKASLEWLIAQNDDPASPFHQKLDTTKVVMGGHSMGALTTFAMADFAPLTLYILVCGGSFGAPTGAQNIHAPAIILGGDTDIGTPNFEDDYEAIPTPVIFLIKAGTDHIACARNNLAPWTAFMRWQLYGEEKWKPDFFAGGRYCTTPWECRSKGWP